VKVKVLLYPALARAVLVEYRVLPSFGGAGGAGREGVNEAAVT